MIMMINWTSVVFSSISVLFLINILLTHIEKYTFFFVSMSDWKDFSRWIRTFRTSMWEEWIEMIGLCVKTREGAGFNDAWLLLFLIEIRVRMTPPSRDNIDSSFGRASVTYQTFVKTKPTAFSVFIEDIRDLLHDGLQSHITPNKNNRMWGWHLCSVRVKQ